MTILQKSMYTLCTSIGILCLVLFGYVALILIARKIEEFTGSHLADLWGMIGTVAIISVVIPWIFYSKNPDMKAKVMENFVKPEPVSLSM